MIRQRQRHAVAKRRFGKFFRGVQQDASLTLIAELARVQLAKSLHQIGLAVKIDRVLVAGGFYLIDADGAAALGLRGEIARLSPFQGFLEPADAFCHLCGVEYQPAQRQQFCVDRLRIGAENRANGWV